MADVRRPVPGRHVDRPPGSRSRGQLILVTALSLAILFVTLALILNTAIYTENLATRSGDIGGATDAVRYHDAARDAVGGVIGYANANNQTDHDTLDANLSGGVEAFRNHSARQFAAGDRAVETELESTVNGTRIGQSDANRNFTNASGTATDWTLVTGVDNVRAATINVTDDTFLGDTASGNEFEFVVDGTGGTWRVNVTGDGPTTVGIFDGTDHYTCTGDDATPFIDLTDGTVDGAPCEGLAFADGIDPPYEISITNGDNINGTYSMVVANESLAVTVDTTSYPHLEADGSGQPFAAHAIYSANLTVVYETPRLYYNSTVRVAPEEPNG